MGRGNKTGQSRQTKDDHVVTETRLESQNMSRISGHHRKLGRPQNSGTGVLALLTSSSETTSLQPGRQKTHLNNHVLDFVMAAIGTNQNQCLIDQGTSTETEALIPTCTDGIQG